MNKSIIQVNVINRSIHPNLRMMKLPCFANSHRKKETSFFCIKLIQLSFIISKKYSIHCNLRKTIDEYS